MTRRGIWLGVLGLLSTGIFAVQPATAGVCESSPTGKYVVCFNHPRNAEDDNAIIDRIVELVNSTGVGDEIRFAMYQMSGHPGQRVIDALRTAKARGVYMRAVLDDDRKEGEPAGNQDAIDQLTSFADHVEVCSVSCIEQGAGSINHNKFFLFELGREPIVMQTSTNLDPGQVKNFNDALEVHNDELLYAAYLDYWKRMQSHGWDSWWTNPDRDHSGDVSEGVARTRVQVFPRVPATSGSDPVAESLNSTPWCTHYHFTTGHLDPPRVAALARLGELKAGCDVRAIVQKDSAGCTELEALLNPENVRMFSGEDAHPNIHSKTLSFLGESEGVADAMLWTGSHNLTENSLYSHDESWLRVLGNNFVSERYEARWQNIWDQATVSWQSIPEPQRTGCGTASDKEIREVRKRTS